MTLHRATRSSPRQQAVEDQLVDHALIGSHQTQAKQPAVAARCPSTRPNTYKGFHLISTFQLTA